MPTLLGSVGVSEALAFFGLGFGLFTRVLGGVDRYPLKQSLISSWAVQQAVGSVK